MKLPKHKIILEASELKLIPHPKRELKLLASELSQDETYVSVFPDGSEKDILYISLVSYTIGHINKNDCLILPDEGLATYLSGVRKPINIEHQKEDVVGFCVKAYLTNIKNNKILDDAGAQEILDSKGLVNVGNTFAVWKINNPEIIDLIEENFDVQSENYDKVKASFEYFFEDFSFFVSNGTADYPNGDLIPGDNPQAEEMAKALRINGGNGKWNGNRISICPHGGFIGGNALTMQPANEFSDITAKKDEDQVVVQIDASVNKIDEKSVINNTGDLLMPEPIKTEVKTEEVKMEVAIEASIPLTVDKSVADAIQHSLDVTVKQLGEKDEAFKVLQAALEASKAEVIKAGEMAQKIQAQLDKEIEARTALEAKEIERLQKELVASRLGLIAEHIEITDGNKALLEKECTATDEDFAKKLDFYKSISNKVVATEVKPEVKAEAAPEVKAVVEGVVAETASATKSVNIIAAAPSDSLQEQFAKAFKLESLGYKDKRLL